MRNGLGVLLLLPWLVACPPRDDERTTRGFDVAIDDSDPGSDSYLRLKVLMRNGCDEDFLDGLIEDNDIGIRVINQGKRIVSVRNLANIFHLWHQSSWSFDNQKYQSNLAIMNRRIAYREPYCLNGIVKKSI